jgi:hypothetical protein
MRATPFAFCLAVVALGLSAAPLAAPGGHAPGGDDGENAEARAALAGIEEITPGTSVLITSDNVTIIHAAGQVGSERTLYLKRLPAGSAVRIVIGVAGGQGRAYPWIFKGVVDASGRAVLVRTPAGLVDLARALAAFGVRVEIR